MTSEPLSKPVLLILSAALILIWGSAFNFVGVAVDHISPYWLTGWRLVVAAIFLTAYAYIVGDRLPPFKDIRWLWYSALGMTGAVIPFLLMAKGQVTVDSGLSSVIVGAMPLLTILLAHFFTDEKLTFFKIVGFVIGFLGVVVLFMPEEFGLGLTGDWAAQLLILGAAFCYALTTVAAKRAPKTPASSGSAIMMIAAAIAGVVAAMFYDPGGHVPNATALTMIVLLGFGSTGVATILYLIYVDRAGPSAMARLNYFPPIVSVAFGVWFLSEPFTWKLVVAFFVILVGVMVSRIGKPKSSSPSEPQTDLTGPSPDQGLHQTPIPAFQPHSSQPGRD